MTIECYCRDCPRHGEHEGIEGPFCFEDECKATSEELARYAKAREQYLDSLVAEREGS